MAYLPQLYVDNMDSALEIVRLRWITAWQAINQAGVSLASGDYVNAGAALQNASVYGLQGNTYLSWTFSYTFRSYLKLAMQWIQDNLPSGGAGAVDMDAIISAMLVATFDQLQYFIGLEDAYRVAIWNAPFNADFYAALARGFQKWP